jgi:hypothetical protein
MKEQFATDLAYLNGKNTRRAPAANIPGAAALWSWTPRVLDSTDHMGNRKRFVVDPPFENR